MKSDPTSQKNQSLKKFEARLKDLQDARAKLVSSSGTMSAKEKERRLRVIDAKLNLLKTTIKGNGINFESIIETLNGQDNKQFNFHN